MAENQNKKRVFLSLREKMIIAEEFKQGVPVKLLSAKHAVSRDVIYRIRREYRQLSDFRTRGDHLLKRKNRRKSSNEALESRLYTWVLEQRALGNQLTDLILLEKAHELFREHGSASFAGSRGWLQNFKKRYEIRLVRAHGKVASADEKSAKQFVDTFINRFKEENVSVCHVYSMVEAGLLWKNVPSKSLLAGEGRLTGEQPKKDRVSIRLCANANGTHKLPPIFFHAFRKPCASIPCGELPVAHRSQQQECMNSEIFKEWYEKQFKPSVREYQLENGVAGKVILFVDSCFSHKTIENEDNFEIIYLPPNAKSLIQPIDQGIIAKFKVLYRHKILRRILQYEKGIEEFYSYFDIKDCIHFVHESWLMTPLNVRNSWNKILSRDCRNEEEVEANALNMFAIHSDLTEMIDTITGEKTSYKECKEILEYLEREETINKNNTDQNIIQDEGQEEDEKQVEEEKEVVEVKQEEVEIKEEVVEVKQEEVEVTEEDEQEEQNRMQVVDRDEQHTEDQAAQIERTDLDIIEQNRMQVVDRDEQRTKDQAAQIESTDLDIIEQNRMQVVDRDEQHTEDQAAQIESTDLDIIQKKTNDLDLLNDIIKRYANNNPATLIIGNAIRTMLENEPPQVKDGHV